jgi:type VI secretion system protein ImpL
MNKPGLSGEIFRILLLGAGITSIAAVVYLAGPYLAIGNWHPFDNPILRQIVVVTLVAVFAGVAGIRFWKRKKNAQALAQGIAGTDVIEDDGEELAERMKDALATLKRTTGGKSDFLYDLPWYMIIGPPGSGKTTALINSGLKFPLAGGATPSAIAGVGGTRYCDWWFTEDAVLIDTAGRYTTQDSDAKGDRQSWLAFLDILKKNRARQPINGVLVAISLHDVLTLSAEELAQHARAIRARLLELHDRLKIEFPVYALFTKGDLVAGFIEYFGHLNDQGRQQVWGATFQTADKKRNLVGTIPTEFDALIERLNQEMSDRLQDEPAPGTRVSLYGFPAQMAALKRPLHDFLNAIFEPTRYHVNAALRGFYFTSGTQQGTPIDQLINALVKNFGAREVTAAAYSGLGKSYFLTDLIQKVIIGEAAWVSMDPHAVRRAQLLRAAALAGILAASAALAGAFYVSYSRNSALIAAVDAAAKEYRETAGPLAHEDVVADHDFGKILPALQKLRYMPTGYEQKDAPVPLAATFGLSQFERLQSSSESAYRIGLERLFRPRLLYRLEEVLDEHRNDPGYIYEALKVYLMLGAQQPIDRDLVLSWERQDWAENLHPGPTQADGRKALEQHLLALIELGNARQPLVQISATVVADSQKTLARLSVSQRAYELLKSESRGMDIPDWSATRAGGPDFDRVFEGSNGADLDTIRVPAFFTYAGFARAFMDRLPGIRDRIEKERWVLGSLADQGAVAEQYKTLPVDLLDIYSKEFVLAWRTALSRLQLKRLTADKPRYLALGAASAAASPLKALLESIRDETALTRERPGLKKDPKPANSNPEPNLFANQGQVPGAKIEAQFRPFQEWVEGDNTRRPIDELIGLLSEIKDNLITSASVPSQAAQANSQLAVQVQRFRSQANRLPDPFKDMMLRAALMFEGDANNSELNQIAKALGDQVSGPCQQVVAGRYPFIRNSPNEIALQDFGRLFAPNGIIDRFFQNTLAKYTDTSKREWTWRNDQSVAKGFSPTTLKQFQAAAQIRDAFFATGGTMPSIAMQVTPPVLSGNGITAKLEMNGASVITQAGTSVSPQALQWPGAAAGGRTAVSLSSDQAGLQPAVLERTGAWSLFRILDLGGAVQRGERLVASFLVGGRELQYQFAAGSANNPFTLPALRDFRCPNGI